MNSDILCFLLSNAMAESAVRLGVDIQDLLQTVINNEKLKNAKINIQPGSEAGDGYVGINSAVEITSDDKVLKLFVKAAPVRAKLTETDLLGNIFLNETFFYKNIYSEYVKFQTENGMKIYHPNVPKFYDASTEYLKEAIVMENLKEQGYVTFDRRNTMNDEHVALAFKQFARFHAVSFALKDQKYEVYENLCKNLNAVIDSMAISDMDKMFVTFCNDVKNMFADDKFISNNIRNLAESLLDVMANRTKHVDKYSIFTQGDCWCNNMMFKYEDTENKTCPADMKLIDWQIPYVNYPVFDLSYFFYTISSKQIMSNYDDYLKMYHDELSKNIRQLGSDPDVLYPYSVLLEQWKRFSRYGLLLSFSVIKIMLTEKDQVANVWKAVEDGNEISDTFNYKLRNENIYKQRIRNILEHFILNRFL